MCDIEETVSGSHTAFMLHFGEYVHSCVCVCMYVYTYFQIHAHAASAGQAATAVDGHAAAEQPGRIDVAAQLPHARQVCPVLRRHRRTPGHVCCAFEADFGF